MRRCLVGLQFRRCSPGASRAPPQMRVTAVTEAEACTAPTSTVPAVSCTLEPGQELGFQVVDCPILRRG